MIDNWEWNGGMGGWYSVSEVAEMRQRSKGLYSSIHSTSPCIYLSTPYRALALIPVHWTDGVYSTFIVVSWMCTLKCAVAWDAPWPQWCCGSMAGCAFTAHAVDTAVSELSICVTATEYGVPCFKLTWSIGGISTSINYHWQSFGQLVCLRTTPAKDTIFQRAIQSWLLVLRC